MTILLDFLFRVFGTNNPIVIFNEIWAFVFFWLFG